MDCGGGGGHAVQWVTPFAVCDGIVAHTHLNTKDLEGLLKLLVKFPLFDHQFDSIVARLSSDHGKILEFYSNFSGSPPTIDCSCKV